MNPLSAPSTFQWLVVHKAHTCFSGARNICTTCPGRSRPRPACGVDGVTYREVSRKPRMPMGRLIRKMLRHPNALTNTPPKRGPERAPMLATAAHMPIAHARFLAEGAIICKRASEFGTSRAAPSPWKARAICKTSSVGARLQSVDASVKRARPAKNTVLLPLHIRGSALPPLWGHSPSCSYVRPLGYRRLREDQETWKNHVSWYIG